MSEFKAGFVEAFVLAWIIVSAPFKAVHAYFRKQDGRHDDVRRSHAGAD